MQLQYIYIYTVAIILVCSLFTSAFANSIFDNVFSDPSVDTQAGQENGKVKLISTFNPSKVNWGQDKWVINNLTIGKPLKIYVSFPNDTVDNIWLNVESGAKTGKGTFMIGRYYYPFMSTFASTNIFEIIPESSKVIIKLGYGDSGNHNAILYAYQ